ncbi:MULTISPECIES: two-component system sensor histidine kinase LytS [Bacillus cereus group]|uniref:histidine kinase n=1 Tax=Bacillus thuringiensis TaxID=1428 RepID=A0A1C4GLJ0_BACTU|nr:MULTISPECIES: two-component system sensor histidine kinase LytS [Bacillus cereus group]MCU5681540.1 two-component system sensor histidine kinase LytS [Bacillus wiedmannii]MED3023855.1 two-component system sensor histidine kinase LytS [Bacillus wiedmannii]OTY04043.1 sensor histidine kinase [Bacillus thuringiensis serovar wratislaviensis]OUB64411.1 histidine kinase [Bacillus thuringiensis serovar sylvestriensis]TKI12454.1 sensor histidine kinase LytS [Bacillus wiedmannii]
MLNLVLMMIERVGLIVILGFLLSHIRTFRRLLHRQDGYVDKLKLICIFSVFTIVSNYTGIEIAGNTIMNENWLQGVSSSSTIANTRIMGVGISGLLGGPIVGIGVGSIAGIHRYMLGGTTALSCAISSILAGVITGYIGHIFKKYNRAITPKFSAILSVFIVSLEMIIILLIVEDGTSIVKTIAIPMILVNSFGSFILLSMIQAILRQEENAKALQTHKVLRIADKTLPYFRRGLTEESCKHVAQIIHRFTGTDAVSLTDTEKILAHVGLASDHHIPSHSLITGLSKEVLHTGKIMKAKSREVINCQHEGCPLQAAIVIPLTSHENTIGTLKLYFKNPNQLSRVEEELAEGLAKIFSTQLELGEAELQSKLLQDAEIKALQAQINPHFLFNAINTVSALCRTDVEKARKLLLQLSVYFRCNLQGARQLLIPLEQELNHVQAYLSLEQARFPNKYEVKMYIEEELKTTLVPPFVLQLLVENALRHAFPKKQPVCEVEVHVFEKGGMVHFEVKDNGQGIEEERLEQLGKMVVSSKKGTGTALYNINERLIGLFGKETMLQIESELNEGTEITFVIPKKIGEEERSVKSISS